MAELVTSLGEFVSFSCSEVFASTILNCEAIILAKNPPIKETDFLLS
jgi:hypothetical protein